MLLCAAVVLFRVFFHATATPIPLWQHTPISLREVKLLSEVTPRHAQIGRRSFTSTHLQEPDHLQITLTDPLKSTKKKVSILSMADFALPKLKKKLADTSNYFITSNKENLVYFDKVLKNWVMHTFNGASSHMSPGPGAGIPLARCLSSAHGGDGYVTTQLEATVYAESTGVAPMDIMLPETQLDVVASLSSGFIVGRAAGYTGAVTCNVRQGQYVQPYLYPYFFEVPLGRRAKLRYEDGKGLEPFGDWEDTPSFLRVVSTGLVECAIGNDSLVCDYALTAIANGPERR